MSDKLFINLNKFLLELVFQSERDSTAKEDVMQLTQICSAKVLESKKCILKLHENINKSDDEIVSYQKHKEHFKDSCINWKPTYDVLYKHENYLQEQFQKHQESTEKDKKMYHDYMSQHKKVFAQYQITYSERTLAKEYNRKKAEFEVIHNRVLSQTEQFKLKETTLMELLVPAPFRSLPHWALLIANLRYKTEDTLKQAASVTQKSLLLKKESEEMETKLRSLKNQVVQFSEVKKPIENTEKKKEKNPFKSRISEGLERRRRYQRNRKVFPLFSSLKSVRPKKRSKPFLELRKPGKRGVRSSGSSSLARISVNQEENEGKECNDSAVSKLSKYDQLAASVNLQELLQFRNPTAQKPSNYKKSFDRGERDAECQDENPKRAVNDSTCISHDTSAENFGESKEDYPVAVYKNIEQFPCAPKSSSVGRNTEILRTSESTVMEGQLPLTSPFVLDQNIDSEGPNQDASPTIPFFLTSATQSPGFSFFDSALFTGDSPNQFAENYSAENFNRGSSQKDIGDLFGKLEEDTFTFAFPTESSTHKFEGGKDDFSFSFPFESDQSLQPCSSTSSPQTTKQLIFF
ncbi:protein SIX6OS1 isoform X1 [Ornithorhynchus anatinus]|uniref:protein SIX6OS1 isoform X1 n=2 Tax=Ornithorhynchus anatinus TaxID=9258 RepID=UPI0010A93BCB|nr:protein SIX6OS1 isoform X1 [Ornithorhynchus anatinus]XP_007657729.2 protein SIX6OS1 isoform X1 [Ornithorhynchus anatinus]